MINRDIEEEKKKEINRRAAWKSRDHWKKYVEDLEKTVETLRKENLMLKRKLRIYEENEMLQEVF